MRISKPYECCLFAVLMVCAPSPGATAQIATATLGGSVRDETGAVLPGVMVTIKSASTGTTRTVTTDAGGRYRIAALDPGEYEIRAELQSFKSALRTGVVLTVGGTTETECTMAVVTVGEEVSVRSKSPLV